MKQPPMTPRIAPLSTIRTDDTTKTIYACAWCYPASSAYQLLLPGQPRYPISHGICDFHLWLVTTQTLITEAYR